MVMAAEHQKLLGTYKTPRFDPGALVTCEVRGEVVIDERHGRNYSAGGQRSVIAVLNRY